MTRARMLARLGRIADAERDLTQAEQLLTDHPFGRARRALLARLAARVRRGAGQCGSGARRAGCGEAVALIAKAGEPMRLAEASLLESRALAKLDRIEEARVAAERGIDAFERALASIDPRDPIRISALDPAWALYSDAARLHLVRRPRGLCRRRSRCSSAAAPGRSSISGGSRRSASRRSRSASNQTRRCCCSISPRHALSPGGLRPPRSAQRRPTPASNRSRRW